MTALALAGGASEAGEPDRIRLHLTNHAGVDGSHLAMARAQAENVFSDIGVRLVWQGPGGTPDDRACTELHLAVTLLSTDQGAEPSSAGPSERVLGIANKAVGEAFIYPLRIEALAERTRRRTGKLLGMVIAHEVGHLLLVPGHSLVGIMARSLESNPTRTWALFTPEQARAIRGLLALKARDCEGRVASHR